MSADNCDTFYRSERIQVCHLEFLSIRTPFLRSLGKECLKLLSFVFVKILCESRCTSKGNGNHKKYLFHID